jgi:Catalytic LigB subunit of aromatic ring-opening dioxygenase
LPKHAVRFAIPPDGANRTASPTNNEETTGSEETMAEILALGISHYPPLIGRDDRMATILRRMLQNPGLPAELRTPEGWPAPMRAEWGDDQGIASAAVHRAALVGWMQRVRAELDAFNPDFVLMWGDDQYENFREDIIPPYCIAAYDKFSFSPPPENVWGETDKTYELAGNRTAAKMLATRLIEQGFDTAYAYKPLHRGLGHAFTNAIYYLDYARAGFHYPIVPFAVNCYGRKVVSQRGGVPAFDQVVAEADLDPPAPTPRRLFDLGAATARILAESPYRVALLASSGWSHAFLTGKNHFLYPDTPADRRMYEHLRDGNYDEWRNYPAQAVEDSGQQELLNWMCLVGALSALERKPRETGFVDTWIFNSSKAFLIA